MAKGVVELSRDDFEMTGDGTWLIDFWGNWCSPCRALEPVLEELAAEIGDARIGKVEIGANPDLAKRFEITTVPTLVVLRDGIAIKRIVGARPKRALAKALMLA